MSREAFVEKDKMVLEDFDDKELEELNEGTPIVENAQDIVDNAPLDPAITAPSSEVTEDDEIDDADRVVSVEQGETFDEVAPPQEAITDNPSTPVIDETEEEMDVGNFFEDMELDDKELEGSPNQPSGDDPVEDNKGLINIDDPTFNPYDDPPLNKLNELGQDLASPPGAVESDTEEDSTQIEDAIQRADALLDGLKISSGGRQENFAKIMSGEYEGDAAQIDTSLGLVQYLMNWINGPNVENKDELTKQVGEGFGYLVNPISGKINDELRNEELGNILGSTKDMDDELRKQAEQYIRDFSQRSLDSIKQNDPEQQKQSSDKEKADSKSKDDPDREEFNGKLAAKRAGRAAIAMVLMATIPGFGAIAAVAFLAATKESVREKDPEKKEEKVKGEVYSKEYDKIKGRLKQREEEQDKGQGTASEDTSKRTAQTVTGEEAAKVAAEDKKDLSQSSEALRKISEDLSAANVDGDERSEPAPQQASGEAVVEGGDLTPVSSEENVAPGQPVAQGGIQETAAGEAMKAGQKSDIQEEVILKPGDLGFNDDDLYTDEELAQSATAEKLNKENEVINSLNDAQPQDDSSVTGEGDVVDAEEQKVLDAAVEVLLDADVDLSNPDSGESVVLNASGNEARSGSGR